jgi:hypothetical protein
MRGGPTALSTPPSPGAPCPCARRRASTAASALMPTPATARGRATRTRRATRVRGAGQGAAPPAWGAAGRAPSGRRGPPACDRERRGRACWRGQHHIALLAEAQGWPFRCLALAHCVHPPHLLRPAWLPAFPAPPCTAPHVPRRPRPDINECDNNPCSANANCTNRPGGFNCTCKPGYTGNGIVCSSERLGWGKGTSSGGRCEGAPHALEPLPACWPMQEGLQGNGRHRARPARWRSPQPTFVGPAGPRAPLPPYGLRQSRRQPHAQLPCPADPESPPTTHLPTSPPPLPPSLTASSSPHPARPRPLGCSGFIALNGTCKACPPDASPDPSNPNRCVCSGGKTWSPPTCVAGCTGFRDTLDALTCKPCPAGTTPFIVPGSTACRKLPA